MTYGTAEACEAEAFKCQTGLPGIREDQCVDDIDEAAMSGVGILQATRDRPSST